MAFDIKLNLSISSGRGLSMTGWAERALAKIADKESLERERGQKYIEERSQEKANAPHRWSELVEVLTEEIEKFSQSRPRFLTMTDIAAEADAVGKQLRSPNKTITLIFQRAIPQIDYRVDGSRGPSERAELLRKGVFDFRIEGRSVWLAERSTCATYSAPEAAEYLLDLLVDD